MLIGMGGGAASSMSTGANIADLDFDSVQRGNAEIQRRAQEVIDRCWELGAANPILSIHDVGAGGLSNALPELVHGGGAGATFDLRRIPSEEPGMAPREIWCNEAQERYVLAIRAEDRDRFAAICERERCPFAVVGTATERRAARRRRSPFRQSGGRHGSRHAARQAAEDDARRRPRRAHAAPARSLRSHRSRRRRTACCSFPRSPTRRFSSRSAIAPWAACARAIPMVGPWQVPVADAAVTLMDFDGYRGEAMAIGERTPLALIDAAGVRREWPWPRRSPTSRRRGVARLSDIKLSANWMAPAGHPGEDAALYDAVRAVAMELCPALRHQHSRRQGLDVDAHDVARRRAREGRDGAGVAHRHGVRAGRTTCGAR